VKSTHELDPYKPLDVAGEPLHVDVIATDWKWVFVYPDLGIATVNQLNFPANRPLAFNITSNSTMNTFFIPQLGGQIYAMAGMRTQLHLIANEPGQFRGMSGNYSGHGFSNMKFIATASSNEEFERWVAEVRSAPRAGLQPVQGAGRAVEERAGAALLQRRTAAVQEGHRPVHRRR
jgi:cytochrome o ubiquinol oxidase subunit 2